MLTEVRQLPVARTSPFDTHPSDADRARAAEALACTGIMIGGDEPASALFHGFDALAVEASRHHYTHDLGLRLEATTLVDSAVAIAETRERERWSKATRSLYGDTLSLVRPIRAPWPARTMALDAAISGLGDRAAAMERDREAAAANVKRFEEQVATGRLADAALHLLQAGFTQISPDDFRLSSPSADDAPAAHRAAIAAQQALEPELQRYEGMVSDRIACALAVLTDPKSIPPGQRADLVQEAQLVVPALNALAKTWPTISDLHHLLVVSEMIEATAPKSPDQTAAVRQTARLAALVRDHLARIRGKLETVPGPEPLAPATIAMLLGFLDRNDPPEAAAVLGAAVALRSDLVGRLASIVLAVEEKVSGASLART